MPKTSLILSTYNKEAVLKIVLESALDQSLLPDEIVIADDGSGENTANLIRETSRRSPVPLLHVWQPDDGYRLPASLNNAVAASSGDYLLFVDGDCFLNRHFIEDHLDCSEPDRYVVGTRVNITPKRQEYILRTGDRRIGFFSWGTRKKQHAVRSKWLSKLRKTGGMAGANFSLWRSDFEKINGFNERFNGHGGSDADLARRLDKAGLTRKKMVFLGMVYHFAHPAPTNRGDSLARINDVWDDTPEAERIRCRLGLDRAAREGVIVLRHG